VTEGKGIDFELEQSDISDSERSSLEEEKSNQAILLQAVQKAYIEVREANR
jgi:hypothetical protein